MLTFGVCTVPAAGRSMIADPDAKPAMDKWSGLEKDALAALARGDVAAAERDVQKLQAKFGEDSCRVSTLQGQVLEAQGRFKDAEALYERLSAGNPGNQVVRKRLAVVHRQLSGEGKFVKTVQEHLDTFAQDVEAVRLRDGCRVFWRESHVVFCVRVSVCPCVRVSVCVHPARQHLELADVFIGRNELDKAQAALEQCVLCDPFNATYHTRLGEVLLSMGGEHVHLARKHFAAGVKYGDSARALVGLALSSGPAVRRVPDPETAAKLHTVATTKLKEQYDAAPSGGSAAAGAGAGAGGSASLMDCTMAALARK